MENYRGTSKKCGTHGFALGGKLGKYTVCRLAGTVGKFAGLVGYDRHELSRQRSRCRIKKVEKVEIKAIRDGYVIYTLENGKTIAIPMDKEARDVLEWHTRNTPANDNKK